MTPRASLRPRYHGPMGSLSSSFIPAGRLGTAPLSPRASLCRIGPRRQGLASPLRALDGSGTILKTRCLRGEGGGSGRGVRGRVASPLAHDKGYYHALVTAAKTTPRQAIVPDRSLTYSRRSSPRDFQLFDAVAPDRADETRKPHGLTPWGFLTLLQESDKTGPMTTDARGRSL